jgi:RNA polymerase sigma-70 factor, ECF subfamily
MGISPGLGPAWSQLMSTLTAEVDLAGMAFPGLGSLGAGVGIAIMSDEEAGADTSADALSTSSARITPRRPADREAMAAELFAAHYGRLAGWCRKLVDDDETAHEMAMEAFTRLISKLHKLDEPVGYLYVIATNLIRDHWRKTRRERTAIRLITAVAEESVAPGGEVELRTIVEALPERLRTPVLLHYYAGFALADVARLTGRPAGTVKSDLFRARALLRKTLTETS